MKKVDYINRYGEEAYKKMLEDNRIRSMGRYYNSRSYQHRKEKMSPEAWEKLKEVNKERQKQYRTEKREEYNNYHNDYYQKNKSIIRPRVNAQRIAKKIKDRNEKEIAIKVKEINKSIDDLTKNYNLAHLVLGADGEVASIARQPYKTGKEADGKIAIITNSYGKIELVTISMDEESDPGEWESWNWI